MRHVTILVTLLLLPATSDACSCFPREEVTLTTIIDELCAADVVFIGEVEDSQLVRGSIFEYKIWPRESLKGMLESPTYALSMIGGGCGFPFKEGGRYLIFGGYHKDTGYVRSSICGLTAELDRKNAVYEAVKENTEQLDFLCTGESEIERRRQRIRDTYKKLLELEEATRESQQSSNKSLEQPGHE